jgi:transposase-like protein
MSIELPKEDFQKVTDEDKVEIEQRMNSAENEVMQLIAELAGKGYQKAANYLHKAKLGLFGYVRRWLKWGLVSPRASSMIERVMRELGRRIKRIAYGWSDRGVEKIAKIILKQFTDPLEWQNYWKQRNEPNGKVTALVNNYRCSSPNFSH